jgi:regulatory LuxR family protein
MITTRISKEIARKLMVKTRTVKGQISTIYRKLNVNNRRAAILLPKHSVSRLLVIILEVAFLVYKRVRRGSPDSIHSIIWTLAPARLLL